MFLRVFSCAQGLLLPGKLVFVEHFKLTFAARRRVCHSFSVHWKRKATLFLDIRFFGCLFSEK